jgi:hypothetical protein
MLVELGRDLPQMPPIPQFRQHALAAIKSLCHVGRCLGSAGPRGDSYHGVRESLKRMSPTAAVSTFRANRSAHSVDELLELCRALESYTPAKAEMERTRAWLRETHPNHPRARLFMAEPLAEEGRWQEVYDLLHDHPLREDDNDDEVQRHRCHLLIMAALHRGDLDEARAILAITPLAGACMLDGLEVLLGPPGPQEPEMFRYPHRVAFAEFLSGLREADARLAADDAPGALAELDRACFGVDEVQSLARRTEAWLRITPVSGHTRFCKIMAFLCFVGAHQETRPSHRLELPLPGATWDRARLDDLRARVDEWFTANPYANE